MPESKGDEIFEQSRQRHLMTIGFLTALKDNLNPETAFEIAVDGFSNYMKSYYKSVLGHTREGTQERFDTFRKHYESYAEQSSYIYIVESTTTTLKVRFERCPFVEVMEDYELSDLTYAFCLSDLAFTKEILPEVTFHREHVIANGAPFCDHAWIYLDPEKNNRTNENLTEDVGI